MRAKDKTLEFFIKPDHMVFGIDRSWIGVDVYRIKDLDLLIGWWNNVIRFAGDPITREIKDKYLREFHSAIWTRVNQLHPKFLLKFNDITVPDLMKKAA